MEADPPFRIRPSGSKDSTHEKPTNEQTGLVREETSSLVHNRLALCELSRDKPNHPGESVARKRKSSAELPAQGREGTMRPRSSSPPIPAAMRAGVNPDEMVRHGTEARHEAEIGVWRMERRAEVQR